MDWGSGLSSLARMFDPTPVVARDEPEYSAIAEAIYAGIEARRRAFTIEQARRIPAVIRSKMLICGVAASMSPLVYRDRLALEPQPRFTRKPDPFVSRWEFVYQAVEGLLEDGCSFWLLTDHDEAGYPRSATVLPHDEVVVQHDDRRFLRLYTWRGRPLRAIGPAPEILHVTIGRRPGELHGRGPLREGLDALYPVQAAEDFAADFFASGGIPTTLLKAAGPIKNAEAEEIKQRWIETRAAAMGAPQVVGANITPEFPGADPQKGQMHESRSLGATICSRLFGIPAALLMVETTGATITYTNPAGALEELVKSTVATAYLSPLEAAWSELLPSPQAVRFDLADLARADFRTRIETYAAAISAVDPVTGAPLLSVDEARRFEGWSASGAQLEAGHQFDAIPSRVPGAESALLSEVPA